MKKSLFKSLCLFATVFALILHPVGTLQAMAQSAPPAGTLSPACKEGLGTIDIAKYGGAGFQNPEEITSNNGVLQTTLEVKTGTNTIAGCDVYLRSYNGNLVGPTLRVKPGDTIKINLSNRLSELPDDVANLGPNDLATSTQNRGAFNVTNFHTHGLHVSPKGNSDNVLKEMLPGKSYSIEVKVPENHPGGTYWYHPHLHRSTALQVSSGMAGALIVEGGLDQLPEVAPAEEKVFVFQQLSYGEDGRVRDYGLFGPDKWRKTGRQITINGQLVPTIAMHPGEVQHWRFVHAGVRETVNVQLQKGSTLDLPGEDIQPASSENLIKLHEIAVDGIPLDHIDSWDKVELEPGYRSDVLVKIDRPGEYQLVDLPFNSNSKDLTSMSLSGQDPGHILAMVKVQGENMHMDLPENSQLAAVKQKEAPPDIADQEISGTQNVRFELYCVPSTDCTGQVDSVVYAVNNTSFGDTKHLTRFLELGKAEEWTLEVDKTPNSVPAHPFHIHINPFQYTRKGPDGKDETIWRDTLLVVGTTKQLVHQPEAVTGHPEKIRIRYTDFDGQAVLHCHILDHEDAGMMELINVVQPSQMPKNS